MKSREVISFLIYPKYFSSLAIPYKGKYLIRIRVYQKKLLNNKITYAYPIFKQFPQKIKVSIKHPYAGHSQINQIESYYQTQTFSLFYSDQRLNLNTYCIFKLQYDRSRQFQTYFQFQLIRKSDKKLLQQTGCVPYKHNSSQLQQTICKQKYQVNQLNKVNIFQRVYFHHHQFYCALDMFIFSISQGIIHRKHKYQIVQFKCNHKDRENKKQNQQKFKQYPNLNQLIDIVNGQIRQYNHMKQSYLKYQIINQMKKSFIYQTQLNNIQNFQDLSHLKYTAKSYQNSNIYESLLQLNEDRKLINDNILRIFYKLPQIIKQITFSTFKSFINESLKKKIDMKKKYLLKKVLNINNNSSLSFNNSNFYGRQTVPIDLQQQQNNQITQIQRNSSTFKQKRKLQKKQFIHIRRQQFIKQFPIINIKQCNFPMLLIQNFCEDKLLGIKNIFQIKSNKQKQKKKLQDINLIILIHGYNGSHYDLKKIRNFLQHLNPKFRILAINSIEKDISENIQFLGQKVAEQIQFYIVNCSQSIKSISFIGFSLGGVLARACLRYLQKYKKFMKLLITLASPHLGVSQSQNAFVNFGIWYLSKIDKAKNIKQLNFQSVTQKDSFLMTLSKNDDISWFQKVIIISCSDDEFVPHYSARIMTDSKNQIINQMANNIMKRIKNCDKIQVWFDIQLSSTFDKVIGRKSHIEFIQNFQFLQMLCQIYQNQF